MVTFIPTINPEEIKNQGERKVAEALAAQLPKRVRAMHSLNWVQTNNSGTLREGECDFVILDENFGLLFVEVKGGVLGYDPGVRDWWRLTNSENRKWLNKNPFKQVFDNMYALVEHIKERLTSSELSCTYGCAVAFPDGKFHGELPPGIVRPLVLDVDDLSHLEQRIRRIFRTFHRDYHQPLTRNEVKKIEYSLYPKFDIVPVLWREIEKKEREIHRLTEEQKNILSLLNNQRVALIQGGAGTGKTLLALAKAQQTTQSGMRTLLLCYNRPLKDWLNKTAQTDFDCSLTINNYHGLVHDFCKASGIEFDPERANDDRQFWNEEAPELLMQACEALPANQKFDAVIVDEGQDFRELWWDSLDSVFKDPKNKSCFYVFFDPNQNLYVRDELRLPDELGDSYPLEKNCRNSPDIAAYCDLLITPDSDMNTHEIEVFKVTSRKEGFQKIAELVNQLSSSSTGGLNPSQIAVLVPGFPVDDWPTKFKRNHAIRDLDSWQNNEGVLIVSSARFKGLEADAVIYLTTPLGKKNDRDRTLKYVACSRAKHILKIVEIAGT